jgi:hypothetical protein
MAPSTERFKVDISRFAVIEAPPDQDGKKSKKGKKAAEVEAEADADAEAEDENKPEVEQEQPKEVKKTKASV